MKRPKYILSEQKSQQKTLAETWFCNKNSSVNKNHESNSERDNKNIDADFKRPILKDPLQKLNAISNVTNSSHEGKENESDDNDFVASSQCSNESKLRKRISKNLSRNSVTSKGSPEKLKNLSKSNFTEQKLSAGELSDCSFIKDEFVADMYDNIAGCEPIEMCYDLNSLLADSKLISNILISSPNIGMDEYEDHLKTDPLQDPLLINDNEIEQSSNSSPVRRRTRSMSCDKSVSKKFCYELQDDENEGCDSDYQEDEDDSTSCDEKTDNFKKSKSKNKIVDNTLPNDLRMKLKLIKIKLQHKVPPQHKIENGAGTRPMTKEQSKMFETYGPLKKGNFVTSEDEAIKKNWQEFCEIHEWDENNVEPFLNARHNGKYYIPVIEERQNFVRFLANGLPWRSLYSVYFRFKNLYSKAEGSGMYTAKEDKIIISHMHDASVVAMNNQCAVVAKILKRKKHSVWQRFQILKKTHDFTERNQSNVSKSNASHNNSKKKKTTKAKPTNKKKPHQNIKIQRKIVHEKVYTTVKWTSPLVNKFIETLTNVTSSSSVQDLKFNKIGDNAWIKVEKSISIDRATLQDFWYYQLHLQLFSPKPIYLNDTKMKLIEYLYKNKDKNLENILWDDVCLSFDGITTEFLSKLFDHLVQYAQNKINSDNFKDIVQYLYEYHIPELEEKTEDVILPKLHYKGNRIIHIDKGSEKKIAARTTSDPLADANE